MMCSRAKTAALCVLLMFFVVVVSMCAATAEESTKNSIFLFVVSNHVRVVNKENSMGKINRGTLEYVIPRMAASLWDEDKEIYTLLAKGSPKADAFACQKPDPCKLTQLDGICKFVNNMPIDRFNDTNPNVDADIKSVFYASLYNLDSRNCNDNQG